MNRYLPFFIILLVAAAAVGSGTYIYKTKRTELAAMTAAATARGDAATAGATPPHVRGPAKASVTIEEFGDFQCPPCEMLAPVLSRIEHDYGAKLRVVFRNFPLAMHPHAQLAARAAESAGGQGKFWEMHDTIYKNRATWAAKSSGPEVQELFVEYARQVGLEPERFKRDLESAEVKARVTADQQRGTSLGVHSTPTLFLNGVMLPPTSLAEPVLRSAIDDAIAGRTPGPSPSPTPSPSGPPVTTLKP